MTRYLVLWDHWEGKSALELVKDDTKNGKLKDFGLFAGTGRGYALWDVSNELELLQFARKYREYGVRVLSAEPVIPLDQLG